MKTLREVIRSRIDASEEAFSHPQENPKIREATLNNIRGFIESVLESIGLELDDKIDDLKAAEVVKSLDHEIKAGVSVGHRHSKDGDEGVPDYEQSQRLHYVKRVKPTTEQIKNIMKAS